MEKFLGQWMPVDASEHGPMIDHLIVWTHWLMLVLFVVWGVYFLYVLWRFNAKRSADGHGQKRKGRERERAARGRRVNERRVEQKRKERKEQ